MSDQTTKRMYTPSAPKFDLNPGTARLLLHYINNPPEPMEYSMDFDFPEPPPLFCTDPNVHQEWLDKICTPLNTLQRQNALSNEDWYILLNS